MEFWNNCNEISSIGRNTAASHLVARLLWNRRTRNGGFAFLFLSQRFRDKNLAGVALESNRIWRFSVPISVGVRWKSFADQPGDRGRRRLAESRGTAAITGVSRAPRGF